MKPIRRRASLFVVSAAALLGVAGTAGAAAASASGSAREPSHRLPSAAPRPICSSNDPGVYLTGDGWAGPNCVTADVFGNPVPPPRPRPKPKPPEPVASAPAPPPLAPRASGKPKPICRPGVRGVRNTLRGWEGPNCQTADSYGRPVKLP